MADKVRQEQPQKNGEISSRFARTPEIETITGLCSHSVRNLEKRGEFPKHRKITGKAKGWWLPDVLAWAQDPQAWREGAHS
jgi:predicted DNA-binding transcriptional regulator AlpA